MILAILSKSAHAETLLNNLAEAEFDIGDVSVVMRDRQMRDAIAKDRGPFQGLGARDLGTRLSQLGLSTSDVKLCADAVAQGKVFVAMRCSPASEAVAVEMFQDHAAELIKVVKP